MLLVLHGNQDVSNKLLLTCLLGSALQMYKKVFSKELQQHVRLPNTSAYMYILILRVILHYLFIVPIPNKK